MLSESDLFYSEKKKKKFIYLRIILEIKIIKINFKVFTLNVSLNIRNIKKKIHTSFNFLFIFFFLIRGKWQLRFKLQAQ